MQPDLSSALWGYATQRISCRKGPGSSYAGGGTFNALKNQWLPIRSRAWDNENSMWWVEVLIGAEWLWTNYTRFDSTTLPLESIPLYSSIPTVPPMVSVTRAPTPIPTAVPTRRPTATPRITATPQPSYPGPIYGQTVYGYTVQRLSVRSGPGSWYNAAGNYNNMKNKWVEVRSRAWDSYNGAWWVEQMIATFFTFSGSRGIC